MEMYDYIIMSLIHRIKRIDLYEIRDILNEPVGQVADRIYNLMKSGHIIVKSPTEYEVSSNIPMEIIRRWNDFFEYKEPEKEFEGKKEYQGELSQGKPIIDDVVQLEGILKLEGVNQDGYHIFCLRTVSKKRFITAPSKKLKERQRWILYNILEKLNLEDCVHGFVKGRSILTNAKCHIGKNEILCLDIENFFPSISHVHIKRVFSELQYSDEVSNKLADLCTFQGFLPQGAPTSPYLANIVFSEIDRKLIEYSQENSLVYTRYADDLTFSSNSDLARHVETIEKIIIDGGFTCNRKKKHIMKGNQKKVITGLLVREDVRVQPQFKKKLRQEIYYCNKFGVQHHLEATKRKSAINFKEYLYGKAYYIKMVEKEIGELFLQQLDRIFEIQN